MKRSGLAGDQIHRRAAGAGGRKDDGGCVADRAFILEKGSIRIQGDMKTLAADATASAYLSV